MDNLTAVTVYCNTPDLLEKAISSVLSFYPSLKIEVFDNSIKNIGHGPAMDLSIRNAKADYILLFDTDIEMKKPCLEQMIDLMEDDTFAVGRVYNDPQKTYNIKFGDGLNSVPIIHPFFHIVQKKEYLKYHPYIQNGGPCFLTALDIFSKGLSDKVLKDFPVNDYVEHRWRGTRDINPPDMFKNSVVLNEKLVKQFAENWNNR